MHNMLVFKETETEFQTQSRTSYKARDLTIHKMSNFHSRFYQYNPSISKTGPIFLLTIQFNYIPKYPIAKPRWERKRHKLNYPKRTYFTIRISRQPRKNCAPPQKARHMPTSRNIMYMFSPTSFEENLARKGLPDSFESGLAA